MFGRSVERARAYLAGGHQRETGVRFKKPLDKPILHRESETDATRAPAWSTNLAKVGGLES